MPQLRTLLTPLETRLKQLGAFCILAVSLVTGADIVGRFFDAPIFGSEEIVTFLSGMAIGLAMPYAHTRSSHIRVEILMRKFSKTTRKRVNLITDSLSFVFFAVVTWRMFEYGASTARSGEVSMNLELPEHLIIYGLAGCFAAFSLSLFRDVILFFHKDGAA
jgi:TRAP-type C4-dicarboxylate transport system permease small subunit